MKKFRIISFFLIALLSSFLFSCDLWNSDLVDFLEYYSNTAGVGFYELDGSYPSVNNVTHIPGGTNRNIEFLLRNPQRFTLNFDIYWHNELLRNAAPQYGTDYFFTQNPYDSAVLTFTKEFLEKLESNAAYGGGDISATITLSASDTQREFEPYSYTLIANSPPPTVANAQFAKAKADSVSPETWWLCFNVPAKEGIHPDIDTIIIDGAVYTYEDSRFATAAPTGLKDSLGNDFILSGDTQRYLNTALASNIDVSRTIIVTDNKGLHSSSLTVNTADIPLVTSPIISTNGNLDFTTGDNYQCKHTGIGNLLHNRRKRSNSIK